jgi:hypothetical protein
VLSLAPVAVEPPLAGGVRAGAVSSALAVVALSSSSLHPALRAARIAAATHHRLAAPLT